MLYRNSAAKSGQHPAKSSRTPRSVGRALRSVSKNASGAERSTSDATAAIAMPQLAHTRLCVSSSTTVNTTKLPAQRMACERPAR